MPSLLPLMFGLWDASSWNSLGSRSPWAGREDALIYPQSIKHSQSLSYVDQFNQSRTIWEPNLRTPFTMPAPPMSRSIRSLPIKPRVPYSTLIPRDRSLVEVARLRPCETSYLRTGLESSLPQVWYNPTDQPVCPARFGFGGDDSTEGMKIIKEVHYFRAEIGRTFAQLDESTIRISELCSSFPSTHPMLTIPSLHPAVY